MFLCIRNFNINPWYFFHNTIRSWNVTFDALLVGLSLNVGLTVGSWEIIIALLLICCNSILKDIDQR